MQTGWRGLSTALVSLPTVPDACRVGHCQLLAKADCKRWSLICGEDVFGTFTWSSDTKYISWNF